MQISWTHFKSIVDQKGLSIQYVTLDSNYWMKAIDGSFSVECLIPTNPEHEDTADFLANYQENGNKAPTSNVITQFEKDDKTLKCASFTTEYDGVDAVAEIAIPSQGRYIAGGYALADHFYFGDRATKVEVVDKDNIFGYGAGVVLKTYHDEDVASENSGWFFEPDHSGTASLEIEPIGGYGFLPEGLYLRVTCVKDESSTASKVIINLWWGKVG